MTLSGFNMVEIIKYNEQFKTKHIITCDVVTSK
jgi:hypothetical protein